MNLRDCYIEEDLFPMIFTEYEERDYAILFYNTDNKDSFDSNHAVIYKGRTQDIRQVLADIIQFYKTKGRDSVMDQLGDMKKTAGEKPPAAGPKKKSAEMAK